MNHDLDLRLFLKQYNYGTPAEIISSIRHGVRYYSLYRELS